MAENAASAGRKTKKLGPGRILLRLLLSVLVVALSLVAGLCLIMNDVFNGPSPTARDRLTMSLLEASATKWMPALFIGADAVEEIRASVGQELPEEKSDPSQVVIRTDSVTGDDEWTDYPDGIRIVELSGDTYNAHLMIIRDPSRVYMAVSSRSFSKDRPGTRINSQFDTEGAVAAINGGAFFDNGTSSSTVGSVPCGLVVSRGEVLWNDGQSYYGFTGFNEDNILVVAKTMSAREAKELKIRDGCCFGPVLVMNSMVNEEAYNTDSGFNPRTAIGQRGDGAVLFLAVDGRTAGSLGATYADLIDIMVEYGAVNACNLDGGSSSVMLYRDELGLYDEAGTVRMVNNYSLLQEQPRRMPDFFMVAPLNG